MALSPLSASQVTADTKSGSRIGPVTLTLAAALAIAVATAMAVTCAAASAAAAALWAPDCTSRWALSSDGSFC